MNWYYSHSRLYYSLLSEKLDVAALRAATLILGFKLASSAVAIATNVGTKPKPQREGRRSLWGFGLAKAITLSFVETQSSLYAKIIGSPRHPDKNFMSLTTGQVIGGHYEVISHLGGGGFGETYLARDLHLPDRPSRVIKRLSPRIQEASVLKVSRRLFETEAQVLYRLGTHPQIPQLFAHFEEASEFYLVQEYINGKDLSHELLRGKVWEQFAVATLLQNILTVLGFVHQNNVIHRDIKPENIIRRRDGQLFLIDFGVVKEIANSTAIASGQELTNLTVGIGTPGYMPSEQAHGEPKFASDIYAIGMIGIQALTGILPSHLGKDENLEILWRQHASQIYPELADILSRMVKFDFRQRYASADTAYEAIKIFCDRFPISNVNHSLPTIQINTEEMLAQASTHLKATDQSSSQPSLSLSAPMDRIVDQIKGNLAIPTTNLANTPLTNSSNPTSNPSLILQHFRPWHIGLGIITMGAIIITAMILLLSESPKPANIASDVEQRKKALLEQANSTQNRQNPNSFNGNGDTNPKFILIKELGNSNVGNNDNIYGVNLSPDGKTVAIASSNQSIELWDLQSNKILQTFKGHKSRVYDVFFSPDGTKLVSGSDNREAIIWDVKTGRILANLEGHQEKERVYTTIFSPDGRMIASSSSDNTVRIWNAETGKQIQLLLEKSWVFDVSFSADSKLLVSGSKDGAIKIWDVASGKVVKTLEGKGSAVRSIVYSYDSKLIASAMEDGTVRLWNVNTGQQDVLTGHTDEVHIVAFSKGDRLLASAGADKNIKLWSVKDKTLIQTLTGHERGVSSVDFSEDATSLVSGSLDGKVKVWQLARK